MNCRQLQQSTRQRHRHLKCQWVRESLSGVATVEAVKTEVKRYKLRKQTMCDVTYSQTPALHACVQGDTHSTASGHVTGRKPVLRINDEPNLVLLTSCACMCGYRDIDVHICG